MPSGGGQPQRLTFLGSTIAQVCGWSSDGNEILFVANPRSWYEGETRPFTISAKGGEPRDLHLGHGRSFSLGASGMVLGRNATDPARWKRYRGGTAGEVWIDTHANAEFERLPLPDGNPTWPMWIGERIYFLCRSRRHRQHLFVRARRQRRHALHARSGVLRPLSLDRRQAHRLLVRAARLSLVST